VVLARRARESRRLWEIYRLRDWLARRRPVLQDGELAQPDAAALAEEFGLVPELARHRSEITAADPALRRLWLPATAAGVMTRDAEGRIDTVGDLSDGDAAVLARWEAVFDCAAGFAEHAARTGPLESHGFRLAEQVLDALLLEMYVTQGPLDVAGSATRLLRDRLNASEHSGPLRREERARVRTRSFAAIRYALDRLGGHGAVERGTFGGYTLTELGTWVMRTRLSAAGHIAPVFGGCAEVDAATLLRALPGFTPRERLAEFDLWRARRGESAAAAELLSAAAGMPAEARHLAMELLSRLDQRAEPGVREQAASRWTGPYCRAWLAANELEPEDAFSAFDRAWLLVDEIVAAAREGDAERFMERLPGLVPPARRTLLALVPKIGHPDAEEALGLVFELHPDAEVTAVAGRLLGMEGEIDDDDDDDLPP
jgi:hypothetical protein